MILILLSLFCIFMASPLYPAAAKAAAEHRALTHPDRIRFLEREIAFCSMMARNYSGQHSLQIKRYWHTRWFKLEKEVSVLREME